MGWGQVLGSALAGPIGGAVGGYAEDYFKGGNLFGGNSWGSSTSGSTSLFTNTLTNAAIGAWQGSQADKRSRSILNEQRAYDRDTLLRLREDAEKAGFNPLTALRNGAANIGSNTYMNAPALSSTDFIAQALMDGINTGFNAPQRKLDEETQRLQNDVYRAQIGEIQANTDYLKRSHGFDIPAVEQYGVSSVDTWMPVNVYGPDGEKLAVPFGYADRYGIKPGHILTADDYQMLFGEIGEQVQGTANIAQVDWPAEGHYPALAGSDNPFIAPWQR